jgi:hypothetical protein
LNTWGSCSAYLYKATGKAVWAVRLYLPPSGQWRLQQQPHQERICARRCAVLQLRPQQLESSSMASAWLRHGVQCLTV